MILLPSLKIWHCSFQMLHKICWRNFDWTLFGKPASHKHNVSVFLFRRVLELGSGSGFTGVVICAQCQPLRYTFTDCHDNVLSALAANVALNVRSSLANRKSRNNGLLAACDGASTGSETKTKVMKLDWETVSVGELEELAQETDVILAAGKYIGPLYSVCVFIWAVSAWNKVLLLLLL